MLLIPLVIVFLVSAAMLAKHYSQAAGERRALAELAMVADRQSIFTINGLSPVALVADTGALERATVNGEYAGQFVKNSR